MAKVNAYRATANLAPLSASQINTNEFYGVDIRGSKSIPIGQGRKIELVGQVFNLFNRTNLLAAWQTNARSSSFGTTVSAANMRQAELAVRFQF
jgi:hypothetical protein